MRIAILLALSVFGAFAQTTNVTLTKEPANLALTTYWYLDGSSNISYVCRAFSTQPPFQWAVTPSSQQGTLTSIVVLTNTGTVTTSAHGFDNPRSIGDLVVVSGSTTAALNGAYVIATVPSTTTFTITTSGVANATYNNAALVLSTTAPRVTAPVWSIENYTYSSGTPISDKWAALVTTSATPTTAKQFICANQATLASQ